jgi:hypothetical protein
LEDIGQVHAPRTLATGVDDVRYPSSLRKLRIVFMLLVCVICIRVELTRRLLRNVQCASISWAPFIPLARAIEDYWTIQRHQKRTVGADGKRSHFERLEQFFFHSQYRLVLAAALVSFGSYAALGTTRSQQSTYICAASLDFHWLAPLQQRLCTVLDLVVLGCVDFLLCQNEGRGARSLALRFVSVGWALCVSMLSGVGVLLLTFRSLPQRSSLLAVSWISSHLQRSRNGNEFLRYPVHTCGAC